jgi:CDP-diglyceride synthetase
MTLILPIAVPALVLVAVIRTHLLLFLDKPVDGGTRWHKQPLIGRNKTYRALLIYLVGSMLVTSLLFYFASHGAEWTHFIFRYNPVILGIVYALSYELGEYMNSFIKRRLGLRSGEISKRFTALQHFFDLSDGVIVSVIVLAVVYGYSVHIWAVLMLGVLLHYCVEKISLKKR